MLAEPDELEKDCIRFIRIYFDQKRTAVAADERRVNDAAIILGAQKFQSFDTAAPSTVLSAALRPAERASGDLLPYARSLADRKRLLSAAAMTISQDPIREKS